MPTVPPQAPHSDPKVSVVVCTFNQQDFIAETLDSILAQQTSFPFEIILADDCSSDRTPQICRDYADRFPDKIRFIRNPENKGVVRNYFDAIRAARGLYIADLAGDDRWTDTHKLQLQAEILDSDPQIQLVHAAWQKFDAAGHIFSPDDCFIPRKKEILPGDQILLQLLAHRKKNYFIHLCSAMFRRDTTLRLLDRYPRLFDDDWIPCEDFQLKVLLASQGKIASIPRTVLQYRVGLPSVSSTENAAKTARFTVAVIRLTILTAQTLQIPLRKILSYYRFDIQYALRKAIQSHNPEVINLARQTIRQAPPALTPSLKTRLTLLLARFKAL